MSKRTSEFSELVAELKKDFTMSKLEEIITFLESEDDGNIDRRPTDRTETPL